MSSLSPATILAHRAHKKNSGVTGCKTKRSYPTALLGYKDIWTYYPTDPMNPECFCVDCRGEWDPDGTLDFQILQEGNVDAQRAYVELLPPEMVPPAPLKQDLALPMETTMLGLALPMRSTMEGIQIPPLTIEPQNYSTFEEIPTSLPAPRNRDVMNETVEERMRNDLQDLKLQLLKHLSKAMDSRYESLSMAEKERKVFLSSLTAKENALWEKFDAVETLLHGL